MTAVVSSLFKTAAPASMRGRLVLSSSGWLLLEVPNSVGRGLFDALDEPGIELPLSDTTGQYKAHISVMRPEELEQIGGPSKVTERGRDFSYTLGKINSFDPRGWPEMSKCWVVEVRSPELEKFRKSYGLSGIPKSGEYKFHITFAVRRTSVLRANDISKSPGKVHTETRTKSIQLIDRPGSHLIKANSASGLDTHVLGQVKQGEATLSQSIARAVRRVVDPMSELQAEAGNYRKGHVHMHGMRITIETPKGHKRNPAWPALKNHYGYIRQTEGHDGDHVDVFLGDNPEVELVYVVDQIDPDTKVFDEHKCLCGFRSLAEAKAAYLDNYEKGWKGLGKITPVTMQQFKEWLDAGSQKRPIATQTFKMKKAADDSEPEEDTLSILVIHKRAAVCLVSPDQPHSQNGCEEEHSALKAIKGAFGKELELLTPRALQGETAKK